MSFLLNILLDNLRLLCNLSVIVLNVQSAKDDVARIIVCIYTSATTILLARNDIVILVINLSILLK